MIRYISRSELKLRESKVTNLQDQLSSGQTPGRRQSAVSRDKAAQEVSLKFVT